MKDLQYVLSTVELFLVLFLLSWLLRPSSFFCSLSESLAVWLRYAPASAHDSAIYVRCEGSASCTVLPVLRHQNTLSQRRHVHVVSDILPGRDLKLTFLSVTDTYMRTYVRMHVHCENRSLIQSLMLMGSAITCYPGNM